MKWAKAPQKQVKKRKCTPMSQIVGVHFLCLRQVPGLTDFAHRQVYNAPMETIYIDSLFLTNLAADYLLLLLAGRVCAERLMRRRIFLAALLGAAYSVLTVLPGFGWAVDGFGKAAAAALMVLTAYGGARRLLRCFVVFFALSFALGGAVYAVSLMGGSNPGRGNVAVVPLRVLVLSFAVCYALLALVFRRIGVRAERHTAEISVTFRGATARFKALRDTGNSLYDPATNRPVMVASLDALAGLFSDEAREKLRQPAAEAFVSVAAMPEYAGAFRLVPFSAIGTGSGLLMAFAPEALLVDGVPENGVLTAISPEPITGTGEYDAVI